MLVTADLHQSDNPRDSYRLDIFARLKRLARKYNVDHVAILGDLTTEKNYHSAWLVNHIADGITSLAADCNVTVLMGNHDYEETEHPFFRFLDSIDGVKYIDRPLRYAGVQWLPHSRNPAKEWPKEFGGEVILTHATFAGAVGENGSRLRGIARTLLPSRSIIISGDVHVPQTLGNIVYVGAPYTIHFADEFEPRVLLLDGTGQSRSIKLNGPQKRVETWKPDGLPIHKTAKEGDIVRIQVELRDEDHVKWAEIRERVRRIGENLGYVVDSVVPLVDSVRIRNLPRPQQPQSDEQVFDAYCRKFQIEELTAKTGKEFL